MSNTQYVKQETTTKSRKKIGIITAICSTIVLFLLVGTCLWISTHEGDTTPTKPFHSGNKNVAVIYINGMITEEGQTYNQAFIEDAIQKAQLDQDNLGILLDINSPGGTVTESDATYLALEAYKKETGRPIYAYCHGLAASGGYYIASAADKIYSNRNALVGSIGVISAQHIDARGLMDKLGIKMETIHTGENKLMGSATEPLTDTQRAIFQSLSDEAYAQFTGIVSESRKMPIEAVKALADGRIYSANQAKNAGLIDAILNTPEAVHQSIEEANDWKNVQYTDYRYSLPMPFFASYFNYKGSTPKTSAGEFLALWEKIEAQNKLAPLYLYAQ